MKTKKITGTFEETATYQEKYLSLLRVCDAVGTMIKQDRCLERDRDIAPYHFFRKGTREYVFPKQLVILAENHPGERDQGTGYGLRWERQIFQHDEALVKGKIQIQYEDADSEPILIVTDLLGNSEMPKKVTKTLDEIMSKK
ncbi:MAG: hypothetical protein Q8L34_04740 [Candidatus Woesearchaeota archaeon]|nr:hypothetical protein [Candidatus Woesearchaeota archaeon]